MKKLICATDVEELISRNEYEIYVDRDTILTPFARDIIKNNRVEIIVKKEHPKKMDDINLENVDLNSLTEFLKIISKDDLLQLLIQKLVNRDKKFEREVDEKGFSLIRGNTITFEDLNESIQKQDIIRDEEKTISILKIKKCLISRRIKHEETVYILGGSLKIEGTNRWYSAVAGDILQFPKGCSIKFEASHDLQILSLSRESNWVDDYLEIKGGC